MKNIILKNGVFGGILVTFVMACVTCYMKTNPSKEPSAIIGFMSMFVAFIFVILGIIQQKKADQNTITFGKAFATGLLISLVISTIYVGAWLIIYYNFFPDFIEKYSQIVLNNTKPEELATKTDEMAKMKLWYKNPIMIILLTFMEILPLGILVSLFGAFLLKKK